MENEQAFQADVEVNALEHVYSRSSHRSTQKGQDTVKIASGVAENERDIHNNEDSPLLSNPEDGEASEHGAGETRQPPKWDGEADFKGRPWWNMPSVSNPSSRHEQTCSDILRYSGSFLPTFSSP